MISDSTRAFAWESAKAQSVPLNLILGIITVESNGNQYRTRFEPGWRYFVSPDLWAKQLGITEQTERTLQAMSFGLMQIMGSVARELGFKEDLPKLCDPQTNLIYGTKKLKTLMNKYALNDAIAAYNAGVPRIDKATNDYVNSNYVQKVLAAMKLFPL